MQVDFDYIKQLNNDSDDIDNNVQVKLFLKVYINGSVPSIGHGHG